MTGDNILAHSPWLAFFQHPSCKPLLNPFSSCLIFSIFFPLFQTASLNTVPLSKMMRKKTLCLDSFNSLLDLQISSYLLQVFLQFRLALSPMLNTNQERLFHFSVLKVV